MSNLFYTPGSQRAAKVNLLFGAIARHYDFINDLQSLGLHRRWKRRVVDLARLRPGEAALDVCCGTGDLAAAMAETEAAVVGLDFNQAMLTVAKSKVQQASRATSLPCFMQGDAQQLPFFDASFDSVTIGYGLRNLSDWQAGLQEMVRVARPGARLIVLDFGKPANAVWRMIYFGYLRLFVPVFGLVICRNAGAYAYILESLRHYPAQRGVEAEMRRHGLANVRTVNILGGAMSINYGEKRKAPNLQRSASDRL